MFEKFTLQFKTNLTSCYLSLYEVCSTQCLFFCRIVCVLINY